MAQSSLRSSGARQYARSGRSRVKQGPDGPPSSGAGAPPKTRATALSAAVAPSAMSTFGCHFQPLGGGESVRSRSFSCGSTTSSSSSTAAVLEAAAFRRAGCGNGAISSESSESDSMAQALVAETQGAQGARCGSRAGLPRVLIFRDGPFGRRSFLASPIATF